MIFVCLFETNKMISLLNAQNYNRYKKRRNTPEMKHYVYI